VLTVDGEDVGDTLMSENLAHPLVCGRYSCLQAKVLTKHKARRIAINVARLPERSKGRLPLRHLDPAGRVLVSPRKT
jgi:hypothetical protein